MADDASTLLVRQRRPTRPSSLRSSFPLMLMFMAGIVEFGRAFQVYSAVNRLATRYAVSWADCSDKTAGTCSSEMATYSPRPTP